MSYCLPHTLLGQFMWLLLLFTVICLAGDPVYFWAYLLPLLAVIVMPLQYLGTGAGRNTRSWSLASGGWSMGHSVDQLVPSQNEIFKCALSPHAPVPLSMSMSMSCLQLELFLQQLQLPVQLPLQLQDLLQDLLHRGPLVIAYLPQESACGWARNCTGNDFCPLSSTSTRRIC